VILTIEIASSELRRRSLRKPPFEQKRDGASPREPSCGWRWSTPWCAPANSLRWLQRV